MFEAASRALLVAALVFLTAAEVLPQQQRQQRRSRVEQQRDQRSRDCTVQREASGLIRGDRIPRGCVLPSTGGDRYAPPQGSQWETALGPCEQYSERIYHTPNPKRSVLTNAARICRPILEASNPANWEGGEDFESFNSNFGSGQRNFGSAQRNFGSSQRNFGSAQRNFGSSQRNFGSGQRHFGRTQRNFGSSRRHFGSTQRNFGRKPARPSGPDQ